MRDPETKPQWFADYEEKQLAFNKDQCVFNKSILERIDNLVKKNNLKE